VYGKTGLCHVNGVLLSADDLFVPVIKLLLANERLMMCRTDCAGASVTALSSFVGCQNWVGGARRQL
jgi:hypothetical protein